MTDSEAQQHLSVMLAKRKRDNIVYGAMFWGTLLSFLVASIIFCWWAWKDVPKSLDRIIELSVQIEVQKALNRKLSGK